MGKPLDPDYFKKYRAAHPEYAARDRARRHARRTERGPRDRTAEYEKRNAARRGTTIIEPLGVIYPELQIGKVLSFWEDELRIDIAQERELAKLEGRCPDEAAKAYRGREISWKMHIGPLPEDRDGEEWSSW